MTGAVARRYAKAIFSLAEEEGTLEATATSLEGLAAVAADPEIAAAITNPLLAPAARQALAKTLADALKLPPTVRNFVALLADHHRLDQLVPIHRQFQRLVDEALGRVRATVTSAVDLGGDRERELLSAFERASGKTVLAEWRVDPELLAGVVVDIRGTVYDGSLRTQFDRLARTIAGSRSYL